MIARRWIPHICCHRLEPNFLWGLLTITLLEHTVSTISSKTLNTNDQWFRTENRHVWCSWNTNVLIMRYFSIFTSNDPTKNRVSLRIFFKTKNHVSLRFFFKIFKHLLLDLCRYIGLCFSDVSIKRIIILISIPSTSDIYFRLSTASF